jgi:hypothetical protein
LKNQDNAITQTLTEQQTKKLWLTPEKIGGKRLASYSKSLTFTATFSILCLYLSRASGLRKAIVNKFSCPFLFCLALLLPISAFGQTKVVTLDHAIGDCMDKILNNLRAETKIAVLDCEAKFQDLSEYISVEISNYIKNNTPLRFVEKEDNPEYLIEADFSERAGQDPKYRFSIKMFDAKTKQIKALELRPIKLDGILSEFTGEKYIPYSTELIVSPDISDLREELAQMRAKMSSLETQKGDNEKITASTVKTEDKKEFLFVFSFRPEFVATSAVMGGGALVEFGGVGESGFYFSAELNGGGVYYGGGFNLGACFNKDGSVKNVLGLSVGYRNVLYFVDFTEDGEKFTSKTGQNVGIAGIFWKFMLGETNNFDITNKFLLGYKNNPNWYNDESGKFDYEKGINLTYSLSVGYTLTKTKGK